MGNRDLNGPELLAFIDQVGIWLKENKNNIVISNGNTETSVDGRGDGSSPVQPEPSGPEHTNESFYNLYKKRLEQLHEDDRIEHHYRGYYVLIDNEAGMGINEFRISETKAQYIMAPGRGSMEYCFKDKRSEFRFLEKKMDDILKQYK